MPGNKFQQNSQQKLYKCVCIYITNAWILEINPIVVKKFFCHGNDFIVYWDISWLLNCDKEFFEIWIFYVYSNDFWVSGKKFFHLQLGNLDNFTPYWKIFNKTRKFILNFMMEETFGAQKSQMRHKSNSLGNKSKKNFSKHPKWYEISSIKRTWTQKNINLANDFFPKNFSDLRKPEKWPIIEDNYMDFSYVIKLLWFL